MLSAVKKEFAEVKSLKQTPKFEFKENVEKVFDKPSVLKVSEPKTFEYNYQSASNDTDNDTKTPIEKVQNVDSTPQKVQQQELAFLLPATAMPPSF